MKIEKTTILAFVAVTLISGLFAKATTNLIVNGSFETGPNPGPVTPLPIGSPSISPWEIAPDAVDYIGTYWVASAGSRSLDLDNTPGFGGVKQSFSTTAGWLYLVTFDMAGNPYRGYPDPLTRYMRVKAAGQSADFSFDTTGHSFGAMGWATESWEFTATGSSTTIEFYSLDAYEGNGHGGYSGYCGPALDNVSVVFGRVPEPTTMALLGLGFVALLKKRRACKTRTIQFRGYENVG
jgi:choice-of-anchor C domain-containing protein